MKPGSPFPAESFSKYKIMVIPKIDCILTYLYNLYNLNLYISNRFDSYSAVIYLQDLC